MTDVATNGVEQTNERRPLSTRELVEAFLTWCARHRAGATCEFYRTRLRVFRAKYAHRAFNLLDPLEIDEYLAEAGSVEHALVNSVTGRLETGHQQLWESVFRG